jgi:hypothetical protein
MHRRVATGGPACPLAQQQRVIGVSNENLPGRLVLYLRVAFQAEVRIALGEHLPIYRTMRLMTGRATLPQRFMLEHKRPGLLAMATAAIFIQARHRRPTGRFENVPAMRIVTLHTIHPPFEHGMPLRQMEL